MISVLAEKGPMMTPSRVILTCVMLAMFLTPGPASGQEAQDDRVAGRWSEQAYGMSLDAPAGSTWVQQTEDGALVKFLTPDASTLSVYIRQSETELTLEAVKKKSTGEISFRYPSAVTMQQDIEKVTVANREGLGLYLLIPDDKQGDWVFGQVYTLINPTTLAVFQINCAGSDFAMASKTFIDMIDSVGFVDPAELDRARTKRIQAGRAWLDSINTERIKSALVPEQWLRITLDSKDIGYMRIRHYDQADHVPPGTGVAIQSHTSEGANTYDTEGKFFEANDRSVEFWTITTTLRTPQMGVSSTNAPPQPTTQNWRQTGLRDGNAMEVSQETPTSIDKMPWKIPPHAYLSQVNSYVLPALLPHDKPTELAFYAFHQNGRKLSLLNYRVEPLPGGSYRVYERPTPDRPEQVSTFSPTGRLIERRLPDGRVFLATTPQELKRIWGKL
jgi:hypothetical protein